MTIIYNFVTNLIIKIRFENIYIQTYYSPPTVKCSTTHNKVIINAKDNTPIFENHVDDFFEYTIKKSRVNEDNALYKVNQYLDEPIATKTTNILEWWKLNKDHFPNLSAMARNFLAIPSTSVASEQMFSCTGRIINYNCTSLDHNTVAALMCQRNWLQMAT
ncbi:21103_t:CDS:1, partial [Cetraspora pellucida]